MPNPAISIITPSFNQGAFIRRTIDSVLSQDVPGLEFIVVDGGSSDETLEVLRSYGNRFEWISERDQGQPDAINKGIARTTAPIIGWLNSDDIYYPDALRKVVAFFDEHPDVDIAYGEANHIDAEDRFIESYPVEEWSWERLHDVCFISQPATFVRRSVFERVGKLDTGFKRSNDYELWMRCGARGIQFRHIPQLLSATRLHAEAATVRAQLQCHREVLLLMKKHLGLVPDKWIFNYAHAKLDARGMPRSRRLAFSWSVSAVSWLIAVRWNRRVPLSVIRTTFTWCMDSMRDALRRSPDAEQPVPATGVGLHIEGIWPDGWAAEKVHIKAPPSPDGVAVKLNVTVPAWHPAPAVIVRRQSTCQHASDSVPISRGESIGFTCRLPAAGGSIELRIGPTFRPSETAGSHDTRNLACMLHVAVDASATRPAETRASVAVPSIDSRVL